MSYLKIKDNIDLKELEKFGFEEIIDFPNYLINKNGDVFQLEYNVKNNRGKRIIKEKYIKQKSDKYGYKWVYLYKNGKQYKVKIHRLVAKTFILNPNNKPQVNHIDGIKYNNKVENLEWCTCKENVIHAYLTGLKVGKSGCHNGILNPNCKLSEKNVLDIFKMKSNGSKIRDVFDIYKDKISFGGLEQIWYGYKWKHLVEKVEEV